MNQANKLTQSGSQRRPKRRLFNATSPPNDAAIDLIVPAVTQSPNAGRDEIDPPHHDQSDDESAAPASQALFTQPAFVNSQPTSHPSPRSPTATAAPTSVMAPSQITTITNIPPAVISIIQDAASSLYGIE